MAEFRSPYVNAPEPVRIDCSKDAGRTKQSFKDECDINRIMKKYQNTGVLPVGIGVGQYGDFYDVDDYMSAQLVVKRAEAQFAALPSAVRARFSNSPAALLAFVADKANYDEARKLGLLADEVKPIAVPPVVEPVVAK